jgi:hypothetical protein
VLIELDAVLFCLVFPPRRHDVQRQPSIADVIDVGHLLGKQGRLVKRRPFAQKQKGPESGEPSGP